MISVTMIVIGIIFVVMELLYWFTDWFEDLDEVEGSVGYVLLRKFLLSYILVCIVGVGLFIICLIVGLGVTNLLKVLALLIMVYFYIRFNQLKYDKRGDGCEKGK